MQDKEYEGYLSAEKEATVDAMSYDHVPRHESFETYLGLLIEACRKIEDLYFDVPLVTEISDKEEFLSVLAYRERVYCYELYHQQRVLLKKLKLHKRQLLLNAETDKSGTIYTRFVGARKPDFVLHRPGDGKHNIAITEVKPISAQISEIEADLEKLKEFLDPKMMNYFGAIMLIYGEENQKIEEITDLLTRHFGGYWPARFKALWHRKPNSKAQQWVRETGRFHAHPT